MCGFSRFPATTLAWRLHLDLTQYRAPRLGGAAAAACAAVMARMALRTLAWAMELERLRMATESHGSILRWAQWGPGPWDSHPMAAQAPPRRSRNGVRSTLRRNGVGKASSGR